MKTQSLTLCSLTAILLVGLAAQVFAQHSSAIQQMQRNTAKKTINSFWNGDGSSHTVMGFLHRADVRNGTGVSEEQYQKIQETTRNPFDDPRAKPILDEIRKSSQKNPLTENAAEEKQSKLLQLQAKLLDVRLEIIKNAVNDNLTPGQIKKFKEFEISTMSEHPIISPSMFEALDLSDAQKQQLDKIKKEMEPEFEKQVDKWIDVQFKLIEKAQDEREKLEGVTDLEERQRLVKEIMDKVRKLNPDLQREQNELIESGKGFTTRLRFKMFDVLTDEQMARMSDLINNPPEYVKNVIAEMRKRLGTDINPAHVWNSWKPGDPIPEGYLKHREERKPFPIKE